MPLRLRTAPPNRQLKTVLLCPWPPSQGPGSLFSDCLHGDPLTISELTRSSNRLSLYSLWADPTDYTSSHSYSIVGWHSCRCGLHRKHRSQQYFHCCVCNCCYADAASTESFPSNGRLCSFQNSGFQQTCYNILSRFWSDRRWGIGLSTGFIDSQDSYTQPSLIITTDSHCHH
jgi:hypothetical protein